MHEAPLFSLKALFHWLLGPSPPLKISPFPPSFVFDFVGLFFFSLVSFSKPCPPFPPTTKRSKLEPFFPLKAVRLPKLQSATPVFLVCGIVGPQFYVHPFLLLSVAGCCALLVRRLPPRPVPSPSFTISLGPRIPPLLWIRRGLF